MKTVISASLLIIGLANVAQASHPHDRVCLNREPVPFVMQTSLARTYENGDSSLDPHTFGAEASASVGDYMDSEAVKFKSAVVKLTADSSRWVPMTLKSAKGDILFTGEFDIVNNTLDGTFVNQLDNKKITAKSNLTCISQPRMTLELADKDIAE